MTRREQNKEQTRAALVLAGHRLFLDHGFDETSVDEVAALAGISRRTLFRYFDSKEAIFFAGQREKLERFRDMLVPAHTNERPFDRVRRAILDIADTYTRGREVAIAQHRAIAVSRALRAHDQQLDLEWEVAMYEVLSEGLSSGSSADRGARWLAGAIIGMVRATLRDWFELGATGDLRALGSEGLDLLTRGFDLSA